MAAPYPIMQMALQLARINGELLKRAQEKEAQHQQKMAAVAARIPATVDALMAGERIFAEDKQAVSQGLTDPVVALDLMAKLAYHRNGDEVTALGKTVSAAAPTNRFRVCGAPVADYDELESGRKFRQALLG